MSPVLTLAAQGRPELQRNHQLVHAKNGVCRYCKLTGNRFGCGVVRTSYYKCEACDVNLCRQATRDCFVKYHALIDRRQSDVACRQLLPK